MKMVRQTKSLFALNRHRDDLDRPGFFTGRLITERDLAAEQRYLKRNQRLGSVISLSAWLDLRRIGRYLRGRRCQKQLLFIDRQPNLRLFASCFLAQELGLHLIRIDLAGVLSKYIGETEKNLARVFDRAEQTGALLFFDEADPLFGKRTEVKDAHDRYANIEINYLLQRLEDFSGIAILASNRRENVDPAFLRRFHWVVSLRQNRSSRVRARKRKNRKSPR